LPNIFPVLATWTEANLKKKYLFFPQRAHQTWQVSRTKDLLHYSVLLLLPWW